MIFRQRQRWRLSAAAVLGAVLVTGCGASGGLAEGDRAPAFSLPAASGAAVALADYAGTRPVLLYFHMADG